jgi:hypothetical protein
MWHLNVIVYEPKKILIDIFIGSNVWPYHNYVTEKFEWRQTNQLPLVESVKERMFWWIIDSLKSVAISV